MLTNQAVKKHYPTSGVSLRPSMVYGDRVISSSLTLPLGTVFGPLEKLLARGPKTLVDLPIIGGLFIPPVSVESVAKAAVAAAADESFPPGIVDVASIQKYNA